MASTESEKFNEYLNVTGYEMLLIHEYCNSVISVWPDDLAVIYCLHVGESDHSVIHLHALAMPHSCSCLVRALLSMFGRFMQCYRFIPIEPLTTLLALCARTYSLLVRPCSLGTWE